ncbi:MAG TPA: class I SAM-dependent methyltransferase [Puia sp.]
MNNDLTVLHPTTRFSDRVENYVKYRPSYPKEIIPYLEKYYNLAKDKRIADIGSGTGIFSELFLRSGYSVIGIEPNEQMRRAAEIKLGNYTGFTSRNHRAEQTGLRTHSLDMITVAQAFHWMDPVQTKKEFFRILKPGGHIVLAWNVRLKHTTFLQAYQILREKFAIDYKESQMIDEEAIHIFFHPTLVRFHSFPNIQQLDFEALKGQLLSASCMPLPGHPSYDDMINELIVLFIEHNENGLVKMEFETKLFINR